MVLAVGFMTRKMPNSAISQRTANSRRVASLPVFEHSTAAYAAIPQIFTIEKIFHPT